MNQRFKRGSLPRAFDGRAQVDGDGVHRFGVNSPSIEAQWAMFVRGLDVHRERLDVICLEPNATAGASRKREEQTRRRFHLWMPSAPHESASLKRNADEVGPFGRAAVTKERNEVVVGAHVHLPDEVNPEASRVDAPKAAVHAEIVDVETLDAEEHAWGEASRAPHGPAPTNEMLTLVSVGGR